MYKTYAMILKNEIIDVVTADTMPVYPPDVDGNEIKAVECDRYITINDIYDEKTGKCIHREIPIEEPEPTQLDNIEKMVSRNYKQAQQDAVDAYTEQLIMEGMI